MKDSGSTKAKLVLGVAGLLLTAGAVGVGSAARNYVPVLRPNLYVGGVSVGGLTPIDAHKKLEEHWSQISSVDIKFKSDKLVKSPEGFSANELGLKFETEKTLKSLPVEDYWAHTTRILFGAKTPRSEVKPVFAVAEQALSTLKDDVNNAVPKTKPAKAIWDGTRVVTQAEVPGMELDIQKLADSLGPKLWMAQEVDVPLKVAQAKVSDSDLSQIKDLVSEYTSRFSEGNTNRASNIKNAAKRLDGTILMPGETFSFNKTLGRRTAENGFKLAGVYNNGKHDFDIGGGICQVSGTLYNSVLLANLKIANRSCHTYPVPYLPVGRDATVSFPAPDFAFTNSYSTPIAISVRAGGGSITFRILGQKIAGMTVKLETAGHQTWGRPEKVINDPSLPPGRRVVEEPGGMGHRITTYRVVTLNGSTERENLGVSYYNGGPRIVRANLSPAKKPVTPTTIQKPVDNEDPDAPAAPPLEPPPSSDGG